MGRRSDEEWFAKWLERQSSRHGATGPFCTDDPYWLPPPFNNERLSEALLDLDRCRPIESFGDVSSWREAIGEDALDKFFLRGGGHFFLYPFPLFRHWPKGSRRWWKPPDAESGWRIGLSCVHLPTEGGQWEVSDFKETVGNGRCVWISCPPERRQVQYIRKSLLSIEQMVEEGAEDEDRPWEPSVGLYDHWNEPTVRTLRQLLFREALKQLSPAERRTLRRRLQGLTFKETATREGLITPQAIWYRQKRIEAKLKRLLHSQSRIPLSPAREPDSIEDWWVFLLSSVAEEVGGLDALVELSLQRVPKLKRWIWPERPVTSYQGVENYWSPQAPIPNYPDQGFEPLLDSQEFRKREAGKVVECVQPGLKDMLSDLLALGYSPDLEERDYPPSPSDLWASELQQMIAAYSQGTDHFLRRRYQVRVDEELNVYDSWQADLPLYDHKNLQALPFTRTPWSSLPNGSASFESEYVLYPFIYRCKKRRRASSPEEEEEETRLKIELEQQEEEGQRREDREREEGFAPVEHKGPCVWAKFYASYRKPITESRACFTYGFWAVYGVVERKAQIIDRPKTANTPTGCWPVNPELARQGKAPLGTKPIELSILSARALGREWLFENGFTKSQIEEVFRGDSLWTKYHQLCLVEALRGAENLWEPIGRSQREIQQECRLAILSLMGTYTPGRMWYLRHGYPLFRIWEIEEGQKLAF